MVGFGRLPSYTDLLTGFLIEANMEVGSPLVKLRHWLHKADHGMMPVAAARPLICNKSDEKELPGLDSLQWIYNACRIVLCS